MFKIVVTILLFLIAIDIARISFNLQKLVKENNNVLLIESLLGKDIKEIINDIKFGKFK